MDLYMLHITDMSSAPSTIWMVSRRIGMLDGVDGDVFELTYRADKPRLLRKKLTRMVLGGAMKGASSLSGRCHTFDVKADGYIKAEGVNAVILKRLSDAIRDGDPIRAVIRGSATNSDGRTPGIASPSSEAQATAIRAAYANAGISDLSGTAYLECHGTGTQVHLHSPLPS